MALKYVAVQSGGYDVTDPVSVRAATRPSNWPQIPLSSEILDDRVYLLFDATDEYCLPQFQLTFTGAVECKMHLYKNTTLFRTDTVTLTSGSYNTTQYEASVDYNYVLVEISGGVITKLTIASGTTLTYDSVSGNSSSPSQLLEISGTLDDLTNCSVGKSSKLKYFGLKKSNGTYECALQNLYSLIAVLEYSAKQPSFFQCYALVSIPLLDFSNTTSVGNLFYQCYSLTTIPQLNTNHITSFSNMFTDCFSLKTIPLIDTSNGTSFSSMFVNCYSLTTIPLIDTSNGTNFFNMFNNCYSLTTIPLIDTSNGTNLEQFFYYCQSLTSIPQLDTSSATNMSRMFSSCYNLITINGTIIRKSVSLATCKWLSHDELVEIIGNLPDLTGETAQTLTLGATLLDKLSADEIAVATNKNWTVD